MSFSVIIFANKCMDLTNKTQYLMFLAIIILFNNTKKQHISAFFLISLYFLIQNHGIFDKHFL